MINAMNTELPITAAMNAAQDARVQKPDLTAASQSPELRKAFDSFVGQTFFGQLLHSMRQTQGKAAYFNGGRGEEIFRQQLDQELAKKMSESSADKFTGPMFELFTLQRK
jgi:peptidoglycan hydrolase FlgJ